MMNPVSATLPKSPTAPAAPDKTWKAATDFEAMVLGEFLRPMFATVDDSKNPFGGGQAEAMWRPMLVEAVAQQIAAAGGLGLSGPIHAAMVQAHTRTS
jgi:peptidoglycan hydrolase FlgJ